jgi:hypothetical protein
LKTNGPQGGGYSVQVKRLLLRRASATSGYALFALATRDDEMIIIAVASPRSWGHIANFHKLPVGHISRR